MQPCSLDNAAAFVGLLSSPFQREVDFFDEFFRKGHFEEYKKAVETHFERSGRSSSTDFELFYKPAAYYMFGRFDLAILALVDDFELSCSWFHHMEPRAQHLEQDGKEVPYPEDIAHKVITGPTPRFSPHQRANDSMLVQLAPVTFLASSPQPLFGLCLLKLSNGFLFGSGTEFFRLVNKFIRARATKLFHSTKTKIIILESYSWHESTLLFFSDSYEPICRFIVDITESSFHDLEDTLGESETAHFRGQVTLIDRLLQDQPRHEGKKAGACHLFATSETHLGIHLDLYKELTTESSPNLIRSVAPDDRVNLMTRWFAKPGHLLDACRLLEGDASDESVNIVLGKGDFVHPRHLISNEEPHQLTRIALERALKPLRNEALRAHVNHRYTIPTLDIAKSSLKAVREDEHPYYLNQLLHKWLLTMTLHDVNETLRRHGVPKILKARVLNTIGNFNQGILDRNLFGYFLELRPFMESLLKRIDFFDGDSKWDSKRDFFDFLEDATNRFEKAYQNRFHNSSSMGDVSDFNFDFKGGIQQLVTCFDAAYKGICSKLGNPESFVYVTGDPGIHSNSYSVSLNYLHLYQPEIFLSAATHEAANFLIARETQDAELKFAKLAEISPPVADKPAKDSSFYREVGLILKKCHRREEIAEHVTPMLFHYLIVDSITFHTTYNANPQLFCYWYWHYFAQLTDAYQKPNEFSKPDVLGFLLRMSAILVMADVEEKSAEALDVPHCKQLRTLYDRWAGNCYELWHRFREDRHLGDWFEEAKSFVHHVTTRAFSKLVETEDGAEGRTGRHKTFEKKASLIAEIIRRGQVYPYEPINEDSSFLFTQLLSYAYLDLLKRDFGKGNRTILRRNQTGEPEVDSDDAPIVFDPMGGVFTHDPTTRRELFKIRSAVTMSLWDMGIKGKIRDLASS